MSGVGTGVSGLNWFVEDKGGDGRLVGRAGNYLNSLGLLVHFAGVSGFNYLARISPKAVRIMEKLPQGSSVMAALHEPRRETPVGDTYHGPVIQGGVHGSNVAINSPDARQTITNGGDALALGETLVAALKDDPRLTDERRAEALDDAESLKDELDKTKPNSKVVNTLLKALAIGSVAAVYISQIKECLEF